LPWPQGRYPLDQLSQSGKTIFMKEIPLTQGKVALVDDEDFERVIQFKWHAIWDGFNWYAGSYLGSRGQMKKVTRMHQLIIPGHARLDHRDGNGLDNQKSNLRPATNAQNTSNRRKHSGSNNTYKGVCFHKANKSWGASIAFMGHKFHLGYYASEIDAAVSYNHAACAYFGEFARLNSV
jgi:hypothetical protein